MERGDVARSHRPVSPRAQVQLMEAHPFLI
jgi:hypothetical protein